MTLELHNLNTYYGKSHILHDISLNVEKGQIVSLLGRNGAGKTTTLRTIMGLTPPNNGYIIYNNKYIQNLKPYKIARLGIGFVPEDRCIFPDITVRDNLMIAIKRSLYGKQKWSLDKIYHYFPVLKHYQNQNALYLSGGEKQMLTIARTLMGSPDLILLDEPCEGLAPQVINKTLFGLIKDLREKEEVTILLAEQNVSFCLGITDWCYLLDKGSIRYQGNAKDIRNNKDIQKQYLSL